MKRLFCLRLYRPFVFDHPLSSNCVTHYKEQRIKKKIRSTSHATRFVRTKRCPPSFLHVIHNYTKPVNTGVPDDAYPTTTKPDRFAFRTRSDNDDVRFPSTRARRDENDRTSIEWSGSSPVWTHAATIADERTTSTGFRTSS